MQQNSDRVSTKEFLKSVYAYFKTLGKSWQWLVIALLAGNIYDHIKFNLLEQSVEFGGNVEFNVDLEGSGQQLGGMAAAFGITGANNSGLLDATNFPYVFMSKTVYQNAFFKEIELFGRKDLFVNFLIDSSDVKTNEWGGGLFKSPSPFINIKFEKKDPKDLTPYENQAITDLFQKLQKKTVLEKATGTSIYTLSAKLTNEQLTKAWLETLLVASEEYYTEMKTVKTRKLIKIQQRKIDSLSVLLGRNDASLSRANFDQPDVVDPYAGVVQSSLTRKNTHLSNQYLTGLTNLEALKNQIIQQEQIFHILTPVTLPLIESYRGGISVRLTGLILLVAAIIIISLRKAILDIMAEEEN